MDAIQTVPEPEYEDEDRPEVKGPWLPVTRVDFDWALERLRDCQAELEAVEAQYRAAVERLEKRKKELDRRAQRGIAFFAGAIKTGAQQAREFLLRGKTKTAKFLHGEVSWRTLGGRLTVSDPKALNEWLAAQPVESGFWRMKIEPEMKALQAHCKETGEVPPGCTWGETFEEVYVRTEAPETALTKGTP